VLAQAAAMGDLHPKHPDAKLICTGHPSKKLSAALAARLAERRHAVRAIFLRFFG